ncbi:hypothetical protein [Streptomyces sp. NBC_00620]|uniref:hypothetical protein n=1 Tax=Streptomyces sp. NBC_00620 TaxID=2903666 RepID=UPI00225A4BFF|nr:hypothetical protein [Streptomyces sp. NBC_00620]MCX4973167.1 hypothetical protein [Streptomyces sp. NBC_00620]
MQEPTLDAPVRDLLAAIRDALDVPLAHRPIDDTVRADLLTRRASDTRVIVELLLQHDDIAHHTARLREWTAEHPLTYPTWQARAELAAAEEADLLADQAARRSVETQFPVVAAFLADENTARGEGR